jgi:PHP family Zn ribbon phosphoesterase
MRVIADLHLHSRFSRATSADMNLPSLARWAKLKGINLLGTGDFTHPGWFRELVSLLQPAGEGIYAYEGTFFLFTVEVAAVWSQAGKIRRVHFLILAPSAEEAGRITEELATFGNLSADGRPHLGNKRRKTRGNRVLCKPKGRDYPSPCLDALVVHLRLQFRF